MFFLIWKYVLFIVVFHIILAKNYFWTVTLSYTYTMVGSVFVKWATNSVSSFSMQSESLI